jgi:hypothetical protein
MKYLIGFIGGVLLSIGLVATLVSLVQQLVVLWVVQLEHLVLNQKLIQLMLVLKH